MVLRSSVVGPFIGGALFAFASAKLFYAALGQGNIASSQWAPFAALYIVRAMRPQGRLRDAALAALFIVLQAYAELTFASFLAIFAGLAVLFRIADFGFRIWRERRSGSVNPQSAIRNPQSFVVRLALIAALCAIGIAPILANMLPDLRAEGDFFTSGGGFADLFSADLAGYALPTQLHPVLGGLIRSVSNNSAPRPDGSQFPVNKGQQIYVGYVALALAAVGLWSGRRRSETWFWAFSALVFFLLTLGPSLRVAGYDLHLPLPFDLIARLPFFKGNRYPSRYSVMLLLSLAPLVALGGLRIADCRLQMHFPDAKQAAATHHALTHHVSRVTLLLSTCLLVFLVLFEHLSLPLPLSDLRVPALYDQIAAEAGDFAVLELPPGWRNGARVAGKQDIVIMQQLWNQTSHGKRLLGGNTSRNPEFKFQFFSEDPTLARLIALTNAADVPQHEALRAALAADPISPSDAQRARDWAATWAIRYIMVHRDKLPPATEEALRQLLPVTLVGESGNLALYRLADDLAPPTRFPVGTDAGRMVLAEGWSPPGLGAAVYAQRDEARLLLPLGPQARQLQLDMWALAPKQSVTLIVDGRPVATQPLSTERSLLTFDLPSDPARPPLSDVRLRFAALAPAAQATTSAQAARPTGIPGLSSLVVRSAGQETGDFAHIFADGADLSPNRRGYNLVAWNPGDGRMLGADAFDTHGDPTASARLAAWVRALPPGAVVAGAARDEASMNLGGDVHGQAAPATEEALRQLLPVTLVGESGNLALYRLADDLAPPTRFPVGTDAGRMVLAEGWSPPGLGAAVYAQRDEARLLLPLGPQARQLQLDMWALAPKQSVTLIVDGRPVATQPLSTERSLLTFDLPSDPARPPLSDVRLRFAALAPAAQATAIRTGRQANRHPGALLARGAERRPGNWRLRAHLCRRRRSFAQSAGLQSRGVEPWRRASARRGRVRYAWRSHCVGAAGGLGARAAAGGRRGRGRAR